MDDEEVLVELLTEDEIRRIAAASRKRGMRLKTAIKRLEQEYERAKGLPFVRNPIAYALYQVWKEADRQEVHHE